MSIISITKGQTAHRGYVYYTDKKVLQMESAGVNKWRGKVAGSNGEEYNIYVDEEHPYKCQCECAYVEGKPHIICKHMVALYFAAYPDEAKNYINELNAYWAEEEKRREEAKRKLEGYILRMRKAELQEALLELLQDGPEWQYEMFMDRCGLFED